MKQRLVRSLAALALGSALTFSGQAQTGEKPLAKALEGHTYAIALESDRLTGPGADLLRAEAEKAQFVLVGEDHGIAEVPRFVAALFKAIHPLGYDHLVIETGPFTARQLAGLASSSDPQRAFAEFLRKHPFSLPFFTLREEADLLASAIATTGKKQGTLWGVDQEFVLAPQFLFATLSERVRDPELKRRLDELAEGERAALRALSPEKPPNFEPFYMLSPKETDLAPVRAHLEAAGDREGLEILRALEASRAVYQKFQTGKGYENNLDRSKLMKSYFADYYERAAGNGKPPRALVKMGATHTIRGMSFMNIPDIGNFLSELADLNGSGSFHILAVAASGTQNLYVPFRGEEAKRSKIEPSYGGPFAEAVAGTEGWRLLDLRPLRPRVKTHAAGDPRIEQIVLGYDAVLVIPEAHAAGLIE